MIPKLIEFFAKTSNAYRSRSIFSSRVSSWNSRLEPPSGFAAVVSLAGTTTLVPFSVPVRVSGLVIAPKLTAWLPENVSIEATYLSFCQLKVTRVRSLSFSSRSVRK